MYRGQDALAPRVLSSSEVVCKAMTVTWAAKAAYSIVQVEIITSIIYDDVCMEPLNAAFAGAGHDRQFLPFMSPIVPPKRSPAHYLWADLIAHIYVVFPLLCPMCGGQMRLISFITGGAVVRKILEYIGGLRAPAYILRTRAGAVRRL